MTIRRKLSIALIVMYAILLVAASVVVVSVRNISRRALQQVRMRELSVMTDDIRAEVFYRMAVGHGFESQEPDDNWWPRGILEDIDVRMNHALTEGERNGWKRVYEAIERLASVDPKTTAAADLAHEVDRRLRHLRRHYDRQIALATAATARSSFTAQVVVAVSAIASAILVAILTLFLRDWFVKPLSTLNSAAQEIGKGNLKHRVALSGHSELAQLGQRIDTMAERLDTHQRQLLESRELATIGELCSNVAHGLRNPLAGVRASAQLASRRLEDRQTLRTAFDDIVSEVDRMDQRITKLFEFSRIRTPVLREVRLSDLLDDALAEARGVLQTCNVSVDIQNRTNITNFQVDHEAMAGILAELIFNAAHHSQPGDTITLSAETEAQNSGCIPSVTLAVSDTGTGISPVELPHVFELFYTARPSGTGMGLPLAKRIIEQHGGTIKIESECGVGSCVSISLPFPMQNC